MASTPLSTNDPCSYSEPNDCVVKRIDLDLTIDFQKKEISGTAHLSVEKQRDSVSVLILDSNGLSIEWVKEQMSRNQEQMSQNQEQMSQNHLTYKHHVTENNKPFGDKLEIMLPSDAAKNLTVSVQYKTSPACSALQWLRPEQTAGKCHPYLFSQCQAIHARSLFPCQDTPSVKFIYTANVKAPKEITVLMSAVRLGVVACEGDSSSSTHSFEQLVPIPSYLVAIVAGDIESRIIGPRSKVWSEKELVDQAEYEFSETENMLMVAEDLLGPYVWGQYDLLVLPPSFPYGGMENPCLTFVTPTLLAGDKSLADVVAHEISHSWTGNLVTNSTFEDFWLNEGHTMFVERKITSRMHGGEPLRNFLANEGWKTLQETVTTLTDHNEAPYTRLIPDLTGVDPDDAFSSVPYEKGFALLFYLEKELGGPEVFEPFVRAYIDTFKYQSINSQQWKDYLFSYFSNDKDRLHLLKAVDWNSWFYAEGMPNIQPEFDLSLARPCKDLASRWSEAADSDLTSFTETDLQTFSALQRREFVALLLEGGTPMSVTKLERMDSLYKLSDVGNSEIRFRWLRLGLKGRWQDSIQRALDFVNEQGRMKFVRPIYRDMYNWPKARQTAIENYQAHRSEMHNTTAKEVEKDLHLNTE